jgi:hypothetical protein
MSKSQIVTRANYVHVIAMIGIGALSALAGVLMSGVLR